MLDLHQVGHVICKQQQSHAWARPGVGAGPSFSTDTRAGDTPTVSSASQGLQKLGRLSEHRGPNSPSNLRTGPTGCLAPGLGQAQASGPFCLASLTGPQL